MSRPDNDLVIPKLPDGYRINIEPWSGKVRIILEKNLESDDWPSWDEAGSVITAIPTIQIALDRLVETTLEAEKYVGVYEE